MNVRSKLLKLLEENEDTFISGNSLANELSVSRNAIWKAVETLRAEGYDISAGTNKGYRLENRGDILSETGIASHIKTAGVFRLDVRKSVTSTNTVLRDLAAEGVSEGYVVAAGEQTAGKGRQGRAFYSPARHGVYFSLLLKPGSKTDDAALITSAAAVAAAQAIERVLGVRVGIKWVNDLYAEGKKVCGILTEAVFGMESGTVESAVLGIGINITRPEEGFRKEIANVATALTDRSAGRDSERCRIIAATLDNFWRYYQNLAGRGFLDEYRARSVILGQDIFVLSGGEKRPGRAIAIDDDCRLIVRYEDGETAALNSGEVSVRPM